MTKLSRLWHPGSVCAKQTLHNKTLFISLSLWANLRYFTARINASWHFFSNFEFLLVVNSIINPSSSTQICILTVTCQWRKTKGVKHLASNSKLNQPDQTFSVSSPGHWLEPSPSPSWVAHRRPVWEMVKVVISNSMCIGWSWVELISWTVETEIWVVSRSLRLRRVTQTRGLKMHDIMRKPNLIIVLVYIFKQSAKEDIFWFCKSSRTVQGRRARKLERLWTRQDNCNIYGSCYIIMSTSHAIEYWLNALNQSDFSQQV